ncbi:hypothetical protein Taro_000641 [Colocasia esculenta]|uniref:Uncharacterized protein n=1 Tax=Colocasia esculenta TaxID=4460 RepID=A0A843TFT4_COLES|nr:hypothetical protein [Colocasia esculenta]
MPALWQDRASGEKEKRLGTRSFIPCILCCVQNIDCTVNLPHHLLNIVKPHSLSIANLLLLNTSNKLLLLNNLNSTIRYPLQAPMIPSSLDVPLAHEEPITLHCRRPYLTFSML